MMKCLRVPVLILFWFSLHVTTLQAEDEHHKLLLVSFDGLRWDYTSRAPDFEAFKYLKENGVKAEFLRSVFPTQTSPNHFSIATGLFAESHGVLHNCYYDLEEDVLIPPGFYETLAINKWWDNGAEPIWITAVNQGLKSGGLLFPGSYATINGVNATKRVLETAQTPTDENAWRERIVEAMDWFTVDDLDMVALYFEQPDLDSHRYGPDDDYIINETLPLLNRTMMYLFEQIEAYNLKDDLNIIIVSDHGFQTINTTVDKDDAISLARYVNQSYVKFQFNYGPLGLIEPTEGDAAYVAEQLRDGNPNMIVYLKEEIPERFRYKNNDRVPSIVVLADPGYAVYAIFPLFHINAGEHGYDNMFDNMKASYYSIGPSFKKGYEINGFDSVHIYPLMCHLLGLDPAPNNGSLEVLKEILKDSAVVSNYISKITLFICLFLSIAVTK